MSKDITCKLPPKRAAIFREALGTDTLCIISPQPQMAELPGLGIQPVYMLDLETLTADQITNLAQIFSQQYSRDYDQTFELMYQFGVPILAQGCTVTVSGQALGLLMPDANDYDNFEDEGISG